MKLGIISLGGPSSKSILEESKKLFTKAEHLDIRNMKVEISNELIITHNGKPIDNYDCVYVRGSYRYALLQRSITRALHTEIYMPLKPDSFTIGHDKFLTLLELSKNKIPLPKTYFAATTESAKQLLEEVNYPIIMKIPSGTQGKGVMFADSISSARSMLDTLEVFNQPYILQEYVETNSTDIRAIVAGNKVVAAMKRKGQKSELRANIHAGATGQPYELDAETEQIAIKSARAIGAEICGVDILDSGGKPQVIEVNLSPGLGGITKYTKKNVALEIAKYLASKTREIRDSKKDNSFNTMMKELELGSKHVNKNEIIASLDIKSGIIKLPKLVSDISQFVYNNEVLIEAEKDKITIRKHEIS